MAEGTIKRLTDKGFGFIADASGNDMFFHMSSVQGVRYEDLREGEKVTFDVGQGPKGPRAENVAQA
ncbi:cold-shock protein [Parasphingomonas frigoris]|jgi:CspA family cold shock protein|uniref:cold-shock protein n=1 Tax=Parasphingomonas frigoris TaxID=3096163 RepID=UPI002FC695D3